MVSVVPKVSMMSTVPIVSMMSTVPTVPVVPMVSMIKVQVLCSTYIVWWLNVHAESGIRVHMTISYQYLQSHCVHRHHRHYRHHRPPQTQ